MQTDQQATMHPSWFDGKTPPAEDCVLSSVIAARAAQTPADNMVSFEGGERWNCLESYERMQSAAQLLQDSGVAKGDRVVVWLPNGADLLQLWLGCAYLGAVFIPLNTDFRGNMLAHALRESAPKVLALHPQLADRLESAASVLPETILICGAADELAPNTDACNTRHIPALASHTDEPPEMASLGPWDLLMVIFTSGTTGPSKGVLCPYGHIYSTAMATYGYLTSKDTMLTELPIFHVGGAASAVAAICRGARLALYTSFSTQDYWQRIAAERATATSGLIGSMADFLAQSPEKPDDANNSLRIVTLMLTEQAMRVARRFSFQTLSGFNMTELSGPLITVLDSEVAGSLGKPRAGCECRVVDDHDMPCKPGDVGELIVRSEHPWTLFAGYLNRPDATAKAWRNGWFHTGDLVRQDQNGNYFFVDRKKDAIRRRGENVSSSEVEAEALTHPAIVEACAVAVASEMAEDEILLAYTLAEDDGDSRVSEREIAEYLIPRMPHFMVPRYYRSVQQLPRTPTNKVRKIALREEGVTEDSWDREAHGMQLKRTRFT